MDINKLSGWGISQQIAQIIEQGFTYNEETGEIFFTQDDLDNLNIALEKKLESLAGIYQMYSNDAEALKNRAKEVKKNALIIENKAENIKKYIDSLMKINKKEKIKVGDKTISYRNSTSGMITDEKALRDYIDSNEKLKQKYYVYSQPEISKSNLLADIRETKNKDGDYDLSIPGFSIVKNKNISIK